MIAPRCIHRIAIVVSSATLLKFHAALVKRKYRRLLSSSSIRKKPGPKGPSEAVISAIVEMKRRNPHYGCPRIAEQIAKAFGIEIDKDVVRRVLAKRYRPAPSIGPSWLTFIRSHEGQLVERRPVCVRIHLVVDSLGDGGHGPTHAASHRLWCSSRSG